MQKTMVYEDHIKKLSATARDAMAEIEKQLLFERTQNKKMMFQMNEMQEKGRRSDIKIVELKKRLQQLVFDNAALRRTCNNLERHSQKPCHTKILNDKPLMIQFLTAFVLEANQKNIDSSTLFKSRQHMYNSHWRNWCIHKGIELEKSETKFSRGLVKYVKFLQEKGKDTKVTEGSERYSITKIVKSTGTFWKFHFTKIMKELQLEVNQNQTNIFAF